MQRQYLSYAPNPVSSNVTFPRKPALPIASYDDDDDKISRAGEWSEWSLFCDPLNPDLESPHYECGHEERERGVVSLAFSLMGQ